jgi:hypothetical protein
MRIAVFGSLFFAFIAHRCRKCFIFPYRPTILSKKRGTFGQKWTTFLQNRCAFIEKLSYFFRSLRSSRSVSLNEEKKVGKKEKKGSKEKTERVVSSKEAQQSQTQTTSFAI